ncbi:hypothetical protein N658DRAFT_155465 [Parathielavia hyrcaniae]|uniref:Mucin n=1 Tax=Parathielavia hyrcaniae TaxID=113614 RepID=A0AAN6PXJ6_9PEZI|nr:hypothetical protein N658DRAFT_155465 [Parathielavia hyrcaniae]
MDIDSQHTNGFGTHLDQSFFDSFRWLEEEENLDLRLFLDDYHAHLREGAPPTKQRPSFRRRMSITKMPFGRRSSVSSGQPGTREATTTWAPSIRSSAGSISNGFTHARRKSRALSLISPNSRQAPHPSVTAFDPAAAHYQDPEARQKLRVYLASPQKFDEAVEFGFPSADSEASGRTHQPRHKPADGPADMRTFWADDDDDYRGLDILSLSSDQPSSPDLDSPKTPEPIEQQQQHRGGPRGPRPRHARLASAGAAAVNGGRDAGGSRTSEGGAGASSREMTLRMTLTRPDLRAHEDEIYGWRQRPAVVPHHQQHSRRPTAMVSSSLGPPVPPPESSRGPSLGNWSHKSSMEKFPDMEHWNGPTAERGVMRRIWNRVRRG